jgi:hypothetical protein
MGTAMTARIMIVMVRLILQTQDALETALMIGNAAQPTGRIPLFVILSMFGILG